MSKFAFQIPTDFFAETLQRLLKKLKPGQMLEIQYYDTIDDVYRDVLLRNQATQRQKPCIIWLSRDREGVNYPFPIIVKPTTRGDCQKIFISSVFLNDDLPNDDFQRFSAMLLSSQLGKELSNSIEHPKAKTIQLKQATEKQLLSTMTEAKWCLYQIVHCWSFGQIAHSSIDTKLLQRPEMQEAFSLFDQYLQVNQSKQNSEEKQTTPCNPEQLISIFSETPLIKDIFNSIRTHAKQSLKFDQAISQVYAEIVDPIMSQLNQLNDAATLVTKTVCNKNGQIDSTQSNTQEQRDQAQAEEDNAKSQLCLLLSHNGLVVPDTISINIFAYNFINYAQNVMLAIIDMLLKPDQIGSRQFSDDTANIFYNAALIELLKIQCETFKLQNSSQASMHTATQSNASTPGYSQGNAGSSSSLSAPPSTPGNPNSSTFFQGEAGPSGVAHDGLIPAPSTRE